LCGSPRGPPEDWAPARLADPGDDAGREDPDEAAEPPRRPSAARWRARDDCEQTLGHFPPTDEESDDHAFRGRRVTAQNRGGIQTGLSANMSFPDPSTT